MTDKERDEMLQQINASLIAHLARNEAVTKSVEKLMATVFGRRGLVGRILVAEGGLALITLIGGLILTGIIMKLMGT